MIITNNNHESMRVNEFTIIDYTKQLINEKYHFCVAVNDENVLVISPSSFDELKKDVVEAVYEFNKNRKK